MNGGNPILAPLAEWLVICTRNKKIARNTVAVGIVVLDRLRRQCPLPVADLVSRGGEVVGSRGDALTATLESYGLPGEKFLKEVTTRQAHQDGQRLLEMLDSGNSLVAVSPEQRDTYLNEAIASLVERGNEWLARQHLKVSCDRQQSPAAWIGSILSEAKGRSGGKVEQHLVGAKLEQRHPDVEVPNHPGHAGDAQTGRGGDFTIGSTCYHVTAAPGSAVVKKCAENLGAGMHPVLLVPRTELGKARHLAEDQRVAERLTIIAIEDFIALNIIEMSVGDQQQFIEKLRAIVESYNTRLEAVETDLSLKIELR